jgi:phosphatidylglycerophosphate synthase
MRFDTTKCRAAIPWAMASARGLLAPMMIAGAVCRWNGLTLAGMVVAALLSDIFDGVLARKWRCDTAALRLFDSIADIAFYLSAGWALWLAEPQVLKANGLLLGAVLGMEALLLGFNFLKFGKPPSYHSYLAKTWGLLLAIAVIAAFCSGRSLPTMTLALWAGVVSQLEGLAMSVLLPVWTRDVSSIVRAWEIRRVHTGKKSNASGVRVLAALTLWAVAMPVQAADVTTVTYTGGTIPTINHGDVGSMDETSPAALVLRFGAAGSSSAKEVAIPYGEIRAFHFSNEVAHHLGLLPTIAVGLFGPRARRNRFSITYNDAAGAVQVVQFDTPKGRSMELLEVLRARAAQACGKNEYNCGRSNER